jgi:hypothetical protein
MNTAVLGALAALSGSALGGIAPLISNYLIQRGLTKREMLSQELAVRQELYSDFIQFGIKVWVSATTKQLAGEGMDELINLYALVSRIRLFAPEPVIEAAEEFSMRVTKRYGEQALSVQDLKTATLKPHVDPLHEFSCRCREEMHKLLGTGNY